MNTRDHKIWLINLTDFRLWNVHGAQFMDVPTMYENSSEVAGHPADVNRKRYLGREQFCRHQGRNERHGLSDTTETIRVIFTVRS